MTFTLRVRLAFKKYFNIELSTFTCSINLSFNDSSKRSVNQIWWLSLAPCTGTSSQIKANAEATFSTMTIGPECNNARWILVDETLGIMSSCVKFVHRNVILVLKSQRPNLCFKR